MMSQLQLLLQNRIRQPTNTTGYLSTWRSVERMASASEIFVAKNVCGINLSISADNARNNAYNFDKIDGVVGIIKLLGNLVASGHAFQASPRRLMTANVYTALLAASINATSTEDGLNLYDSGHRFEHVQLLLVLLRSLPYASTALQCRVLQDLLFLACSHPDNRSFLTQMEEWPEWLLEVLISIYERTSVKSLNSSSLGDVEDLIHSFMIIMLEHSMRQKDGWKDIEATIHKICLLNSAAATYFSNCLLISAVATYFSNCLLISATAAYFSRSVFFKILSNLFQHQSYFFKDFDSSIGHLISVTYFSIGLLQDFDSSSSSLFQHRSSSRF